MKWVVHCKKEKYDVYIGRPSKWGNPFPLFLGRAKCIEAYEKYLLSNDKLFADLHELKGKVLGCYCAPLACHGDVLAKYANKEE